MLRYPKQFLIVSLILLFLGADISWIISRQIFVSALKIQYSANFTTTQVKEVTRLFYAYSVFITIYFICLNLAYWLFTIKYWSLSHKIMLISSKKQDKRIETRMQILFYFGVCVIIVGSVGYGWSEWTYTSDTNIRIFYEICFIPLIVSCFLITDAIVRMRKFAFSEQQIISN